MFWWLVIITGLHLKYMQCDWRTVIGWSVLNVQQPITVRALRSLTVRDNNKYMKI